jgi:hypothetical protein
MQPLEAILMGNGYSPSYKGAPLLLYAPGSQQGLPTQGV